MNDVFIIVTCFYLSALVLVFFISFQIEAFLMRRRIRKKGVRETKTQREKFCVLCCTAVLVMTLQLTKRYWRWADRRGKSTWD